MAWVQDTRGTTLPQRDWPTHPIWQKGHAADPEGQGILAGRVQEEGLFCHGSHPLEHRTLRGEIHARPSRLGPWTSLSGHSHWLKQKSPPFPILANSQF